MKNVKKLLSILMVLTLVLSLGATAFAATVTIEKKDELNGHTFTAYQIFKGTQAEGSEKLASIQWGDGINETDFLNALIKKYPDTFKEGMTPTEVAEAIASEGVDANEVAKIAAANTKGDGTNIPLGEGTDLADGYYVIKDTTDNVGEGGAYNDVILQVTEDINITWKSGVPSSEKKVQDDGEDDWQDSADWDIGDNVPFQITGTLPKNYSDYDTYYLAFHDVESEGLSFNADSVKVYVDNVLIETGYEVKTTELGDNCTFEIIFANLKDVVSAHDESVIRVEYTSELTEKAVIGTTGNPNTMKMEYSNNPNGDQKGTTPEDTVIVFTYEFDANKVKPTGDVDEDGNPTYEALEGAGFTLLKQTGNEGDTVTLGVEPNKQTYTGYVKVTEYEVKTGQTTFEFKGLDDGDYLLVESTVPDGYNKAPDVAFKIEATHEENAAAPKLLTFKATGDGISVNEDSKSGTEVKGEITLDVINQSGLELPETGGIGTTIFYVAGAVLVAAAVILLVTRKRMSGTEK